MEAKDTICQATLRDGNIDNSYNPQSDIAILPYISIRVRDTISLSHRRPSMTFSSPRQSLYFKVCPECKICRLV